MKCNVIGCNKEAKFTFGGGQWPACEDHVDESEKLLRENVDETITREPIAGKPPEALLITLPAHMLAHYTSYSAASGKSVSDLVVRDLEQYHEYRRWLANEGERCHS